MKGFVKSAMFLSLGVLLVGAALHPEAAPATKKPKTKVKVQVVDRAVVGGYAESITYVSGGRFEGLVAMAVGGEVLGMSPDGAGGAPAKLFDFQAAGPRFRPTGLVYVSDWDRFVANDSNAMRYLWPEHFQVFDAKGAAEAWPVVRGEGIATTDYSEGLAYVPLDAAGWPPDLRGRFLMVGFTTGGWEFPRVDVIEAANGVFTVTRQLPIPDGVGGAWGSLAVLPSGELLLSAYGDCHFYRADAWALDALPAGEPMALTAEDIAGCTSWTGAEGLTTLPDSRVVASPAPSSLVTFTPPAPGGMWTEGAVVPMQYGLGLYTPSGLAWDDVRDRFLLKDVNDPNDLAYGNKVFGVPASLSAVSLVRRLSEDPDPRARVFNSGITYRGDTDAVVVGRVGRAPADMPPDYPLADVRTPALAEASLIDPGAPPVYVDLTATLGLISGWSPPVYYANSWNNGPSGVAFQSDEGTFAVVFRGDPNTIRVLRADGSLDRTIPLAIPCADPAMAFQGYGQIAAVPPSATGVRYLVPGQCQLPVSIGPDDVSAPLLVFLDESGHEVSTVESGDLGWFGIPSHVAAITSGKRAGDFAALDRFSQLVVFRVK